MEPGKYRKRPIVIDAVQYDGTNELPPILQEWCHPAPIVSMGRLIIDDPVQGTLFAYKGDWIIRGTEGEIYPCKNSVFKEIYELVQPTEE